MDIFEKFYNDVKETIDPKNLLSNEEIVYWLKKDIAELEAARQSSKVHNHVFIEGKCNQCPLTAEEVMKLARDARKDKEHEQTRC